jgi:signal transduction histidine kinase
VRPNHRVDEGGPQAYADRSAPDEEATENPGGPMNPTSKIADTDPSERMSQPGRWRRFPPAPESGMVVAPLELRDLLARARTSAAAFPALVALLRDALPLRAAALQIRGAKSAGEEPVEGALPLCWCEHEDQRGVTEQEAARAVAACWARTAGGHAADPSVGDGWLSLALTGDDGSLVGAVALAPEDPDDARARSLLAFVARAFEESRAEAPSATDARELISDLTSLLLDDVDDQVTLPRFAGALAAWISGGCVIATSEGDAERRILSPPSLSAPPFSPLDALLGRVRKGAVPLTSRLDPLAANAARALGAGWLFAVPLSSRREVVGTFVVFGEDARPPLSMEQVTELGRRVGLAMVNGGAHAKVLGEVASRDRRLRMVAHDIKNQLGVVLLCSSRLLADDPCGAAVARHAAECIDRSATRMSKLVRDLLDVASIEAGALVLEPTVCDVAALVEDAFALLTPVAAKRGVVLENGVSAEATAVWADRDRIAQVLDNLIENAIKFTPPGGRVGARAACWAGELAISISDTGKGMSVEETSRAFEPFWQAVRSVGVGAGLGLSICRSIVEQSGGRIGIRTAPREGTTVTFTLPLEPLPAGERRAAAASSAGARPGETGDLRRP